MPKPDWSIAKGLATAFAAGAFCAGIEALIVIQNPVRWFFIHADSTALIQALASYGAVAMFAAMAVFVLWRESVRSTALSIGAGLGLFVICCYAGQRLFGKTVFLSQNRSGQQIVFLIAALCASMLLSMFIFKRLRNFRAERRIATAVFSIVAVLFLYGFFYSMLPSYRFLPEKKPSKKMPNVLIITLDTTRADHLGCYGYNRNTTPFLDSIAAEGMLFENAYTTATWTLPAHTSLFTGQLPAVHGVGFQNFFLSRELVMLPEMLSARGFTTAGFIGGPFVSSTFGMNQGFDYYDEKLDEHRKLRRFMLFRLANRFGLNLWPPDGHRSAAEINAQLFPFIEWLQKRQPYFLFINYFDPHDPYEPEQEFVRSLGLEKPGIHAEMNSYQCDPKSGIAKHPDGRPVSQAEFDQLKILYDGELRSMDSQISRLWKQMMANGLLEDTLVIFVADHGESIGEHQFWDHGHLLYQEQVKIPLILWKKEWKSAARISDPVQIHDLFPTVLEFLHIPVPQNIQGRSVLNRDQVHQRPVLAEMDEDKRPHFAPFKRNLKMILEDQQKYIEASNDRAEYYDLTQDSHEQNNLAESRAEASREMARRMNEIFLTFQDLRKSGKGELDEETRERLRALGYAQ